MSVLQLFNPLLQRKVAVERVLGRHTQDRAGPLLIVLAGVHGNEPSGVLALQAVFEELRAHQPSFRGTVIGIAGNLAALAANRRFINQDLNRMWLPERIEGLRHGGAPQNTEERELREIDAVLQSLEDFEGPRFFLDCHTTSSDSIPYISVPSDPASVQLAGELPVHTVIGGGDELVGVSDRYLIDRGMVGFTFEAGRHHRLASIEAQHAAIWLMLHQAGCIRQPPEDAREALAHTLIDGHKYYEFEYVHKITPESGFRMKPGFCNFDQIHEGDLLAWEHERPLISRWNARLFLPLYQKQGDDGFSVIREERLEAPAS